MSVNSGPPELPPDSPGSSVSSRLQNEYDDLLRRAVVLSNGNLPAKSIMNQIIRGSGQKKNDCATDLIDLSSPETHRTDTTEADNDTQREQIPSLHQLLSTAAVSSEERQLTSTECDDPLVHRLLRYSELITNDSESKPITEKMDHWYLDLKKNLMNEFDKLRLQFLEEAQENILREKQAQAKEYIRLNEDIKTMREMLIHYEHTVEQKGQTEKNLNKALDLLYNKTISYHQYYKWRLAYIEKRRQEYSLALAKRFYEEKLKRRALTSWKNLVEREWKRHFELACEKKSKAILNELGNEYELKCKQLELQLLNANDEIARLKLDKNENDESLKKAFMRGVCALNMEAMTVLLKDEHELDTAPSANEELKQRRYANRNGISDEQLFDEGVTLSSSSTTTDEENRRKCSSYRHTRPTHVYKEYLPSTIYRTGEARSIRPTNHHRHVTFHKRSSSATSRSRDINNNILVERHVPISNIRS